VTGVDATVTDITVTGNITVIRQHRHRRPLRDHLPDFHA